MSNYTAHQINSVALAERREQAVRLYQSGKCKSYTEIGEIVGAHPITVGKWIRSWKKFGLRQLKNVNKGGRPVGSCRHLSPHEEAQIKKDLIDHCPDQLKLPFALWTRQAVKLHIQSLFGIDMPIRTALFQVPSLKMCAIFRTLSITASGVIFMYATKTDIS